MTKKEKEILFSIYADNYLHLDKWSKKGNEIMDACNMRDMTYDEETAFDYIEGVWDYWKDRCADICYVIKKLGLDLYEFENRYREIKGVEE